MTRTFVAVVATGFSVLRRQGPAFVLGVLGLAGAATVAIVMLAKIRYETSFDGWIPGAAEIHRLEAIIERPGEEPVRSARSPAVAFDHLPTLLPQAVLATRAIPRDVITTVAEERVLKSTLLVDATFLDVFPLPTHRCRAGTALRQPDAIALTRSAALSLFGTEEVLERTLRMRLGRDELPLRVACVLEDLPPNTHLRFEALVTLRPEFFADEPWVLADWSTNSALTYVKVAPGATPADLEAQIRSVLAQIVPRQQGSDAESLRLQLRPLRDVHLTSSSRGDLRPAGSIHQVWMLWATVIGTLAMAALNYASLATAVALRRDREFALRRVFGASSRALALQAGVESVLMAVLAAVIAAALTLAFWPALAALTGENFPLSWPVAASVGFIALGFGLLLGVVSAVLPVLHFTTAGRRASLYAQTKAPAGTGDQARAVLCALQVAIAVGLMTSAVVVYKQAQHLSRLDLGYSTDGLISLNAANPGQPRVLPEALLARLRQESGVTEAGRTLVVPGETFGWTVQAEAAGESGARAGRRRLEAAFIDDRYFATLGIPILAGRSLEAARPADAVTDLGAEVLGRRGFNVVIDTEAVRDLGFASPAQAIGARIRLDHWNDEAQVEATVVGVAGAHRLRPSTSENAPARVYMYELGWANNVVVRCSSCSLEALMPAWNTFMPSEPYRATWASAAFERMSHEYELLARTYAAGSLVAGLIALTSLYGMVSFTLTQRQGEIALRRVLGASRLSLFWALGRPMAVPVLAAVAVAIPLTIAGLQRWLDTFSSRIAVTLEVAWLPLALCLVMFGVVMVAKTATALRRSPTEQLRDL